jgi:phospholipase D1/2
VDDRTVVIGSANINDRSLLGTRDSEIAVLIHDAETVASKMGGRDWQAGAFAHELRCRLWREHLGRDCADVGDPSGDAFKLWRFTATTNRKVFEVNFACMPRDE